MLDARWLELLKASGWQLFAIAAAAGIFLYLGYVQILPPLEPWMVHLATAVMAITGLLWLASAAAKISDFTKTKISERGEANRRNINLKLAVGTLNPSEIDFLKEMVTQGHRTHQLNPFTAGRIAAFVHLMGVCEGLQSKDIVEISLADREGKSVSVTITPEAWSLLQKKFKEA